MSELSLLLRSFDSDFAYAHRLIDSFKKHNRDGLTLFCVVSPEDLDRFSELGSSFVHVMADSELRGGFTDQEVASIRPGYINQEVVKLAFWELGLTKNYFCVDSDAVFVRDFGRDDFLAPDGYPYSVLVEDKDLKVDPEYFRLYWTSREENLKRIAGAVDLRDPILRTCHGHQVFSSTVLRSFKEDFLEPRGWRYLDALAYAPYEFSWYNFWLQARPCIPIHAREPLIKVFHTENQYLEAVLSGVSSSDVARGYIGWVINSNFSRPQGLASLELGKSEALAPFLSYGEVSRLVRTKIRSSLRRAGRGR